MPNFSELGIFYAQRICFRVNNIVWVAMRNRSRSVMKSEIIVADSEKLPLISLYGLYAMRKRRLKIKPHI